MTSVELSPKAHCRHCSDIIEKPYERTIYYGRTLQPKHEVFCSSECATYQQVSQEFICK